MKIDVTLKGIKPIMFDRYPGDNKTQLKDEEKFYLDKSGGLVVPALNVYSLLAAENTKSAAKLFLGRGWQKTAMAVAAFADISPNDIPLLDSDGKQTMWTGSWTDKIRVHQTVARVAKGIPNPKSRPRVELPWSIGFSIDWTENKDCSVETLRNLLSLGGKVGLGTFRPFFGRYILSKFEVA